MEYNEQVLIKICETFFEVIFIDDLKSFTLAYHKPLYVITGFNNDFSILHSSCPENISLIS